MIGPPTFNRRPATRAASFAAWGTLPQKIRLDQTSGLRPAPPAMGKVDPVVDDGDRPTCMLQQWAVCALTATDCMTLGANLLMRPTAAFKTGPQLTRKSSRGRVPSRACCVCGRWGRARVEAADEGALPHWTNNSDGGQSPCSGQARSS